jgi:hypothetical protein
MPLPKPKLAHMGVAAWSKMRIFDAVRANFSEAERELHSGSWSSCHCGRCSRYARCKFHSPRCVGDVLHNVDRTGGKAASRIATVGQIVDHFADDVVISFGMGAGSCVSAWELARGAAVESLFGVEIEPIATRVARATFPHAQIAPNINHLEIPREGRLVAITSLVLNVVDGPTARKWATRCAQHDGELLWINIGRVDEPGALLAFAGELARNDRQRTDLPLPMHIDSGDPAYGTSASLWRR